MVKKLSNEIIDMKRNAWEGNQGQRPYNPFFKRNLSFKSIEPPPDNLNIDLGNVASDYSYTFHQENHSERDFPQWVHAMNFMANRFLDEVTLTEQPTSSVMNVSYQEEIDPSEDMAMLIWDPDLIMPSNDLFESQEQPAEVSMVVKTQVGVHLSQKISLPPKFEE
jgi:hypothetical protein